MERKMNEDKKAEFIAIAEKMMKFINENGHPHMSAVITSNCAELVEGVVCHVSDEFVKG